MANIDLKRKGITHLYKMTKKNLTIFFKNIEKNNFKFKINVSEKWDGSRLIIGKENGELWLRTSYIGPVYENEDYDSFIREEYRGGVTGEVFNDIIKNVFPLLKNDFPNNTEVQFELLHHKFGRPFDSKSTIFIGTPYRNDMLWPVTLIIINATGNVNKLTRINSRYLKVYDFRNRKQDIFIDVSGFKKILKDYNLLNIDEVLFYFNSRKKEDKEYKSLATDILNSIIDEITIQIFEEFEPALGTETEGVVFEFNGKLYKVIDEKFSIRKNF